MALLRPRCQLACLCVEDCLFLCDQAAQESVSHHCRLLRQVYMGVHCREALQVAEQGLG